MQPASVPRTWPLVTAFVAGLGSLVASLLAVKSPYLGDPGPGFVMPEPTLFQYVLAVAFIVPPLVAIALLLFWPARPWRVILVMLATGLGIVDLLTGIAAIIVTLLIIQSVLRGRYPLFF